MFFDCSEVIISVVVKHLQLLGLFICLADLLSFPVPGEQKKLQDSGLPGGIGTHADPVSSEINSKLLRYSN